MELNEFERMTRDAIAGPNYRHQLVRVHMLFGEPEEALRSAAQDPEIREARRPREVIPERPAEGPEIVRAKRRGGEGCPPSLTVVAACLSVG